MENDKQVFKDDIITKAVDKCNEILKPLGLCVGELGVIGVPREYVLIDYKGTEKLVTSITANKLKKLNNE